MIQADNTDLSVTDQVIRTWLFLRKQSFIHDIYTFYTELKKHANWHAEIVYTSYAICLGFELGQQILAQCL